MYWKVSCLPIFLLAALLLAGCYSGGKIAVVNSEKAIQESEAGKVGMAYLENLSKEIQEELVSLQKEAENGKDKETAQNKLQLRLREAQQRFSAEQQQVFNKVEAQFKSSLETYRTKEKLDVVLFAEAALAYNPQMDITQQVITAMNRTKVTFTPVKPESAEESSQNASNAPQTNATEGSPQTNATKADTAKTNATKVKP